MSLTFQTAESSSEELLAGRACAVDAGEQLIDEAQTHHAGCRPIAS